MSTQVELDNSITGSPVLEPFRTDELRVIVEYFGLAGTLKRVMDIAEEMGLMGGDDRDTDAALAPHKEKLQALYGQLVTGAEMAEDILVLALETDLDTPEGAEVFERFVARHEGRIRQLLRTN
jgi:hypothetical protein